MADIPAPPPGFQIEGQPNPDAAVGNIATLQGIHNQLQGMDPQERIKAFAALPPALQQGIQRMVAQQASTPEAQQARFQQAQAQNVADMGTLGRLWTGIGEGASNFLSGVKENAIDRPLDLITGGDRVAQDQQRIADERELSAPLNNTAAGAIGNVIGGVAESAPLLLIPGGGETAAARLGLGALTGAGYGYLAPSASGGEEIANTALGAAAGPILSGAAKGAQLVGRGVKSLAQPFIDPAVSAAQRMGSILDRAGVSSAQLRQGVQDVPGVEPTLAGVVPTAKPVVQLERSLRNNPETGPQFATRDMQNDRARVAQLQQHTQPPLPADTNGTPTNMGSVRVFDPETGQTSWQPMDALKAAELQRAANFQNFADNNLAPTTPKERFKAAFDALMNGNPGRMSGADFDAIQNAVKTLRLGSQGRIGPEQTIDIFNTIRPQSANATNFLNTAADAMNDRLVDPAKTLSVLDAMDSSANPIVRRAAAQTRDLITKKIGATGGDSGMVHAAALNDVRENLGNIIRDAAQGDVRGGKQAQTLLAPLRDEIVSSIDKKIPGYADALSQYAQESRPINTAQAVRDFLNPTKNPTLATDTPKVTAAQVKAFLTKKRPYPLASDATNDAQAVQQSIQRAADAQANVGATGSQTAANWASRLGHAALHTPAYMIGAAAGHMVVPGFGGFLAGTATAGAADALRAVGERRVVNALGDLAMNPRQAADALDAYLATQGRRQAANRAILPTNVRFGNNGVPLNLLGYFSGITPEVFGPYRSAPPPVAAASGAP